MVFVEGEHDITYINKAAELLDKQDILTNLELRQRGGSPQLDKLWEVYRGSNWETAPQKKLLLYDCDVDKQNDDLGFTYKRIIPSQKDGFITKGIENLLPKGLIDKAISFKKAFVDIKTTKNLIRGIETNTIEIKVNKDEKKNFCNWICENGNQTDFKNFEIIFNIIQKTIFTEI